MISRMIQSSIQLLATLVITFILIHAIPGGPFDSERRLPPEIIDNLHQHYGLIPQKDKPWGRWVLEQFVHYLNTLKQGQLGPSLKYRDRDVSQIIGTALGPSVSLGLQAFGFALILGVGLALIEKIINKRWLDFFLDLPTTLLLCLPVFVSATFLVLVFSFKLKWFPPALWESPAHQVLPMLTLSLIPFCLYFRFTRQGLDQELNKPYIQTALAKGLSLPQVLWKHALKNTLIPLSTISIPILANLITGSFIVETLFAIPGLGRHFVSAVMDRDLFLVMGITLTYAVGLSGISLLSDLFNRLVDIRMRGWE